MLIIFPTTCLAPAVELFPRSEINNGFVEAKSARVNRGAGYSLELTDCMDLKYGKLKQLFLNAGLMIFQLKFGGVRSLVHK